VNIFCVDDWLGQRPIGALMHRNKAFAGNFEHGEDIAGCRFKADIAKDRGDRVWRAEIGDQHQQGLCVIDAAVGIENEFSCHCCTFRAASTRSRKSFCV
jgi:hypothetical protein